MIEVYVAFTKQDAVQKLEETLEAWNLPGMEPVAVQVKPNKFELHRRVTAESLAADDYILAEIGYGPLEENFGELAEKLLTEHADVGLFGVEPPGLHYEENRWAGSAPHTVVICRKGVITHWPTPRSDKYIQEHMEAYRHAGYKTFLCSTLHYHPLVVSLHC